MPSRMAAGNGTPSPTVNRYHEPTDSTAPIAMSRIHVRLPSAAAQPANNIALIDLLGWAITGAMLFAGCAAALGSRTWIRDIAIGAVLSVGSWYLFTVGLGVPLPAAILDGIL